MKKTETESINSSKDPERNHMEMHSIVSDTVRNTGYKRDTNQLPTLFSLYAFWTENGHKIPTFTELSQQT
jgi:hypothetical protein